MMNIGYRAFEFEPVERKKFTQADVVNEVRSKHLAAVNGTVKLSTTDKPKAGVRLEIEGVEGAVAYTNKDGRFSIKASTMPLVFDNCFSPSFPKVRYLG